MTKAVICIVLFATVLLTNPVCAKSRPWMKFENGYFIAYSNAKEKTVRKILKDFELFRAVSYQIAQSPPPADTPKALILLTATEKEYQSVRPFDTAGAFTANDGQRSLLVMTLDGSRKYATESLRHEYGHALMLLDGNNFPAWYAEGYAEIMAGIVISRKRNTFKLGSTRERLDSDKKINNWIPIIKNEFDPHKLHSNDLIAAAYTQSFLLSHYYLLSGEEGVRENFERFFLSVGLGEPETDAFENAFGYDPNGFWNEVLRPYAENMPTYTFPLPLENVDPELSVAPDSDGAAQRFITLLRGKFNPDKRTGPVVPIASIDGSWSATSFDSQCQNTHDITVDADAHKMIIKSETGSGNLRVDHFDWVLADGYYELTQLRGDEPASASPSSRFRVSLPEPGLICFSGPNPEDPQCWQHLVRCHPNSRPG